jgi:hypothetical protein
MQDIILNKGLKFSEKEKKKCLPTVHKILELVQIAREFGVLNLETEAINLDNPFFSKAIELIANGRDSEYVEKVLRYLILSEERTGGELLEKIIIYEGILAIQRGINLSDIACLIGAILGEKYLPIINENELTIDEIIIDLYPQSIAHPPHKQITWPESAEFEQKLLDMNRGELFQLLESISHYNLVTAFYGCGAVFIYKIRDGVSEKTYSQICEDLHKTNDMPREHVLKAQKQILEIMDNLSIQNMVAKKATASLPGQESPL